MTLKILPDFLKVSVFGVFLVRIHCKCEIIRTRKIPNTDTFHAVFLDKISHKINAKNKNCLITSTQKG